MIKSGLVSVTFRQLTPAEIIDLVCKAGLDGIEWGGDIHVPHGNLERARQVYALARDKGISTASYGSYYRAGLDTKDEKEFEKVLETALELNAGTIRIWAGAKGSLEADNGYRLQVAEDIFKCADLALKNNVAVALEYHGNTLTDSLNSTVELIKQVSHKNMHVYWQPPVNSVQEKNLEDIDILLPHISNIHIFQWAEYERMPLSDGEDAWDKYLGRINDGERQRYAMLEFVKDDSPEQFLRDAAVLKRIIEKLG